MSKLRGKWRKNIPIFDLDLYLVADGSVFEAFDRLPRSFRNECSPPDLTWTAGAFSDSNGKFAILFGDSLSEGLIAHEVSHVVEFMMKYLGAKPRFEGETVGHLSQYITDWIYAKLMLVPKKK